MEVTGFHAKRCEFDPEYDQEAECIVADLEFQEDEPEDELQARHDRTQQRLYAEDSLP